MIKQWGLAQEKKCKGEEGKVVLKYQVEERLGAIVLGLFLGLILHNIFDSDSE